jgi:hypothetical protein
MFHRHTFLLPAELDEYTDEEIDTSIDRILVLAMQYGWNPTVRLSTVHRSIKAWHLYYWDGDTEWVRDVTIDRDLEGLACALRKAIPDLQPPIRDGNPLHYFGKSGMEELSAALEHNLAQETIDAEDVVTTSGAIVDLYVAVHGLPAAEKLHGVPDQGPRSPSTPLSGEALESRSSLGGELPPNG